MRSPATPAIHAATSAIAVALAFVGCAAYSWRRLGSLVVDGGHELEVPRRLLEGQALYRDVRWYWGPFAPWLNSILYRAFGPSYDTLMWAGIVSAALASVALYLLALRFVGPWLSAFVGVAFVTGAAFAQRIPTAIFNFVQPFNFSATYGITLALWSVLLLMRHAATGSPASLLASAALAGVVATTKLEAALAVGVAHLAYLVTVLPRPGSRRVLAWACGVGIAAGAYAATSWASDGQVWPSLVELTNPAARFYIRSSMGLEDGAGSAVALLLSALGWAVIVAVAMWAARSRVALEPRWGAGAVAAAVAFVMVAFALRELAFRAMPLAAPVALGAIVRRRLREGEDALDGRWREHAVMWAFALAALARIPLRVGPNHYGFYLLPPSFVCLAAAVHYVPAPMRASAQRRILSAAAAAALAGFAAESLATAYPLLTRPAVVVETPRVHLRAAVGTPEAAFVPYLSRLPRETVVAAVPEGEGLIFAAGLTPTADPWWSYVPMHVFRREDEQAILEAWERRPPALVLYWGEDTRPVFGYLGLGHDYALELGRWLQERYVPYGQPVEGMVLLVPRARSGPPR